MILELLFGFSSFSRYFIKETFYKGSVTETSEGAVLRGGESGVPSHHISEGAGEGGAAELERELYGWAT